LRANTDKMTSATCGSRQAPTAGPVSSVSEQTISIGGGGGKRPQHTSPETDSVSTTDAGPTRGVALTHIHIAKKANAVAAAGGPPKPLTATVRGSGERMKPWLEGDAGAVPVFAKRCAVVCFCRWCARSSACVCLDAYICLFNCVCSLCEYVCRRAYMFMCMRVYVVMIHVQHSFAIKQIYSLSGQYRVMGVPQQRPCVCRSYNV